MAGAQSRDGVPAEQRAAVAPTGACPHLGGEFTPLTGEQLVDPYPFYARARSEEPAFFSPTFGMWFITRYADITTILADPGTFSSLDTLPRPRETPTEVQEVLADYLPDRRLLNTDPPAHTRLRLLIRQGFTPRRVAALEPVIREVATDLVDAFAADGQVDLISQFAYPLPLTVILGMLGVPAHDMPTMRRWTQESIALNFAAATLPLEEQVAYARGKLAFQRYTRDLVTERAQAPREDLISDLLQARYEGISPLSAEEVSSLIPGLIIAGHESTAKLIGNTMLLLLTHPEQWQALQRDPTLVAAAVEEGLRIEAPVLGMVRTTTREVTVGGVTLPAGARLFLMYGSANHDETHFADAEQFRPDGTRRASHLAFGHGIHFCLGAPLARLEARIAIETLGRRLPGLRLAPEQSFARVPSLVFRGLARLGLVWDPCP